MKSTKTWKYLQYKVAPHGFLESGNDYTRKFAMMISEFPKNKISWYSSFGCHRWYIGVLEMFREKRFSPQNKKVPIHLKLSHFCLVLYRWNKNWIGEKDFRRHWRFFNYMEAHEHQSWFNLVKQVSNYSKLINTMSPSKPILSLKAQFPWTPQLNVAFLETKMSMVNYLKEGMGIFSLNHWTCLYSHWP